MNRTPAVNRKGSLLVELLACGALLGVVLTTVIPALRWVLHQRQLTEQREAALLEVENLMERATALDWHDLTTDRVANFRLSDTLTAQLAQSRLAIAVEPDPDDDLAKIVRIDLTWDYAPGRPAPPARLTAWVYRRKKQAEN
jgi:Tfp pilus assembly protein PilE